MKEPVVSLRFVHVAPADFYTSQQPMGTSIGMCRSLKLHKSYAIMSGFFSEHQCQLESWACRDRVHTFLESSRMSPSSETVRAMNLPICFHSSWSSVLALSNSNVDRPASRAVVKTSCMHQSLALVCYSTVLSMYMQTEHVVICPALKIPLRCSWQKRTLFLV